MSSYAAAFMGLAGALGLRNAENYSSDVVKGGASMRGPVFVGLCLLAALFLAYLTNPNDGAFRSFLTDLSFQSQLRRLRSAAAQATSPSNDAHVLNFSNRIAISLRTPPYVLRSYGFFSTVSMAAAGSKKGALAAESEEAGKRDSPFGLRPGFFVGAFGRWWAIDDGSSEDGRAEKDRLASSVMAMEAVDIKLPTPTHSPNREGRTKLTTSSSTKTSISLHDRRGSGGPRTRSDENSPSPTADKAAGSHPPYREVPRQSVAQAPTTPALVELQQQLLEAQSATNANEAKLQAELEVLKAKKRDEDAVRADLKTRGRAAEDLKRQADHEHAEAAKKASSARVSRQTALDRMHSANVEIARLDRKSADLAAKSERSARIRSEKEGSLRKEVDDRQRELAEAEIKAKRLAATVEELEAAIEHRKSAIYARLAQSAMPRQPVMPAYTVIAAPWTVLPDRAHMPSNLGYEHSSVGAPAIPTSSFLEHRMQHMSDAQHSASPGPFGLFNGSPSVSAAPPTRGVPLPLFSPPLDDVDPLLAANDAKEPEIGRHEGDGMPVSPMTPNHRGLIPSTLFEMLDGDDDDVLQARDEPATDDADFPWPATLSASSPSSGQSLRHPLSLNPGAKAFNFARPLPTRTDSGGNITSAQIAASTTDKWSPFSPFD